MSNLKYFQNYMYGLLDNNTIRYEYEDKGHCISQHITYMLNRTQSMFKWNKLPKTISQRDLELYLQLNGKTCWYEHEGNLYVFFGNMGGVPNEYYLPTQFIIANPYLKLNKVLNIDEDCVIMKNDSMYVGLYPIFSKYATLMTEVELSIKIATVNSRIIDLISAPDDRTKESALQFLDDIEDGKLGVIAENAFLDGIRSQPYGNTSGKNNTITSLIELLQYLKASWYNELGINSNYNMKREAINTAESQLNNDALFPLVDNMLRCRKEACEEINEKYGTDISVELDSSWLDNVIELQKEQANLGYDNRISTQVEREEPEEDDLEDTEESDDIEDSEVSTQVEDEESSEESDETDEKESDEDDKEKSDKEKKA